MLARQVRVGAQRNQSQQSTQQKFISYCHRPFSSWHRSSDTRLQFRLRKLTAGWMRTDSPTPV